MLKFLTNLRNFFMVGCYCRSYATRRDLMAEIESKSRKASNKEAPSSKIKYQM